MLSYYESEPFAKRWKDWNRLWCNPNESHEYDRNSKDDDKVGYLMHEWEMWSLSKVYTLVPLDSKRKEKKNELDMDT
jgi:hypothetical protein